MTNTPSPQQLEAWIESYLNGTISKDDKQRLDTWFGTIPDKEIYWSNPDLKSAHALQSKLLKAIDEEIEYNKRKRSRLKIRRLMEVAAALLLFAGLGFVYLHYQGGTEKVTPVTLSKIADVQPGTTKATLMLSNGKKIILDSADSVNISIVKGAVCLIDRAGQKSFLDKGPQLSIYNTLLTHRGEQAPPIQLADGTKVWVNAASTLRFPLAFTGGTREIYLSGEAYFEVAKDPTRPFIVHTGSDKIEVLGTHFDVMAYKEEPLTYATLLKGSIRIIHDNNSAQLKPGQQGQITHNGTINIKEVDATQSVAWLQGEFPMDGMDVPAFMREVSRWYNVDIVYQGKPPVFNFSGSLNRNVPLSQLLAALNANGIRTELRNRKIILHHQ